MISNGFLWGIQAMGGVMVVCVALALTLLLCIVVIKWWATQDYKRNRKGKE